MNLVKRNSYLKSVESSNLSLTFTSGQLPEFGIIKSVINFTNLIQIQILISFLSFFKTQKGLSQQNFTGDVRRLTQKGIKLETRLQSLTLSKRGTQKEFLFNG